MKISPDYYKNDYDNDKYLANNIDPFKVRKENTVYKNTSFSLMFFFFNYCLFSLFFFSR